MAVVVGSILRWQHLHMCFVGCTLYQRHVDDAGAIIYRVVNSIGHVFVALVTIKILRQTVMILTLSQRYRGCQHHYCGLQRRNTSYVKYRGKHPDLHSRCCHKATAKIIRIVTYNITWIMSWFRIVFLIVGKPGLSTIPDPFWLLRPLPNTRSGYQLVPAVLRCHRF